MSIKISELPQATSVGSSDIVPIVQGGTTKQATAGMMNLNVYSTMGRNPSALTLASTNVYTDIGMEIVEQIGNVFSVNNSGNIVLNADVDFALVTLTVPIEATAQTRSRFIKILLNGTDGSLTYSSIPANVSGFLTLPNILLTSLKANDIIEFQIYGQAGDRVSQNNARFTIIAVNNAIPTQATVTRSLNLTKTTNTGSLVGLGDKAEITDETLEKTKLDEVTDKDVGELTTEAKEESKEAVTEVKEEIKDEKGSGDNK